jgi:hypothetical protein
MPIYQTQLTSMTSGGARKCGALILVLFLASIGLILKAKFPGAPGIDPAVGHNLTKSLLAQSMGSALAGLSELPKEMDLHVNGQNKRVSVEYTFHEGLQEAMEGHFRTYRPDYGAFVALDAASGRVLSMVSFT